MASPTPEASALERELLSAAEAEGALGNFRRADALRRRAAHIRRMRERVMDGTGIVVDLGGWMAALTGDLPEVPEKGMTE